MTQQDKQTDEQEDIQTDSLSECGCSLNFTQHKLSPTCAGKTLSLFGTSMPAEEEEEEERERGRRKNRSKKKRRNKRNERVRESRRDAV